MLATFIDVDTVTEALYSSQWLVKEVSSRLRHTAFQLPLTTRNKSHNLRPTLFTISLDLISLCYINLRTFSHRVILPSRIA